MTSYKSPNMVTWSAMCQNYAINKVSINGCLGASVSQYSIGSSKLVGNNSPTNLAVLNSMCAKLATDAAGALTTTHCLA